MEHLLFGRTGLEISKLGLGTWQFGGQWGDEYSDDTALAIMRAAVDRGVNFFDTADIYGLGRSEELIGRFLRAFVGHHPADPRLVAHVEIIRDTENKADLAGKDIAVKSKDEIAVLGDTINDMTHGLVKAALASQDLTIGKEVQKMFIPLETDSRGNKLTTGRTDTKGAEFFGYYEGAKGVSGDYFDYLKLDERYFAVIKCDVAGKGVPAALIMIEVATLFLNFFKTGSRQRKA